MIIGETINLKCESMYDSIRNQYLPKVKHVLREKIFFPILKFQYRVFKFIDNGHKGKRQYLCILHECISVTFSKT